MTETAIEATETEAAEAGEVVETTEYIEVTEADVAPSYEPADLGRPIQTVGRRKEAVVRVRLTAGTGNFVLNGRTIEDYFPNKVHQQHVSDPFVVAGVAGSYDVIARIDGGGITGQAGALRLGVARALNEVDAEASRAALKKAGMLTRDARVIERKKAGLKKARKAPQYSKR